ncbi:hypothetical protein [Pseudomonas reinekei]|nr:hypothetical protein [Pseudomonas reinekei]
MILLAFWAAKKGGVPLFRLRRGAQLEFNMKKIENKKALNT